MITKDQYEEAKKIVEEYEENERMEAYLSIEDDDDDYDDRDWEEEEQERMEEEKAERAASCTCGAWVFGKDGVPRHVADCCCSSGW